MKKARRQTDYAAELEQEYKRWDLLREHGGSDPFWPDGVSMNLVRNHIIYYKKQLAEQENTLFGLPDVYDRDIPPEVDCNYMARPDNIREDARKAMETIDADENLKFIREQSPALPEQQIKQWCIPAIINYAENLRRAIAEDDLVIMRRYRNLERYLESFESAALKIRDPESPRPINGNLTCCPFGDEEDHEDDEDFEDTEDCGCYEPEQEDSSEEQQDDSMQLTLF